MDNAARLMAMVYSAAGLEGISFVSADNTQRIPYPIRGVIASLCSAGSEGSFLLGDSSPVESENVELVVMTEERAGGEFCRDQAKEICTKIIELDGGELIRSVKVLPVVYDSASGGWKTVITLGMRDIRR